MRKLLAVLILLTAGIVSVLTTQVATSLRGALARRRERIALMALVHLEVMNNERIVERLRNEADPFETGEISSLHDDTWRENRARIAQPEAERAVEYLGMYYTRLASIISANDLGKEDTSDSYDEELAETFEALHKNLGPLARYVCERQTRTVRVWSNGMSVAAGRWKRVKEVGALGTLRSARKALAFDAILEGQPRPS